jgi:hypothetical protein
MRRIAFNSAALFEEHLADIANGLSQKIAPLILRSEQDQLDQALAHLRDQLRQIDRIIPFNVLTRLSRSAGASPMNSRLRAYVSNLKY